MKKLKIIIGIVILVIVLFVVDYFYAQYFNKTKTAELPNYQILTGKLTSDIDVYQISKTFLLHSFEEYQKFLSQNNLSVDDRVASVLPNELFEKYDYLVYIHEYFMCGDYSTYPTFVKVNNKNIELSLSDEVISGGPCGSVSNVILIPVEKNNITSKLPIKVNYISPKEPLINKLLQLFFRDPYENVAYKPILYLYPTKDTNITVKLENKEKIITSYPKYNNGWNVFSKTNGDLYDKDGKYYYALYWDEVNSNKIDFKEGFYVTKASAINFLEEKLTILGLNNRERNEFIMYWLPILEKNNQSLVYFELTEERQKNNSLIIEPPVDSLLRINMHIKKVNNKIEIKEQELKSFKRIGFTAIEWGGTIYP